MNLEAYRIPDSAFLGVWIELPNSEGARFLVRLPAPSNPAWSRRVLALMLDAGAKVNDNGEVDYSAISPSAVMRWEEGRLQAFLDLCIVQLPEGVTREQLAGQYRPALVKLFAEAEAQAEQEKEASEGAVGKSLP